jgi:hypothetical protein
MPLTLAANQLDLDLRWLLKSNSAMSVPEQPVFHPACAWQEEMTFFQTWTPPT